MLGESTSSSTSYQSLLVLGPADIPSAPDEVPNCDMAKIEIYIGGRDRICLDCNACRRARCAFLG